MHSITSTYSVGGGTTDYAGVWIVWQLLLISLLCESQCATLGMLRRWQTQSTLCFNADCIHWLAHSVHYLLDPGLDDTRQDH